MRLYYILPVCVALIGSFGWSLLPDWKTTPPVIAPEGDDLDTERILTSLAEPAVGWEFLEAPLPDFASWLEQELKVKVSIDEPALQSSKIDLSATITCQLPRLARDVALTRVLGRLQLAWDIVDGELVMKTRASIVPRQYTRLYAVKDLVQLRDGKGNYDDGGSLVDAVVNCVDATEWEANGAGNSTILFMPATNCLAVSAPYATQQKVQRMLASLRTMRAEQGGGVTYYPRNPLLPVTGGGGGLRCGVGSF